MNAFSRRAVNLFGRLRNARRTAWVQAHLAVAPGATCLEIGSGNGDLAARLVLKLRPARFVATDLDPLQVDAARRHLVRRFPNGLPAGLEVEPADMLALPYGRETFDLAFAFVSLHHASPNHRDFTDVPRALSEVNRVLRPGGALVYEEFVHREAIRAWFRERGYAVEAARRGWRRELSVLRKPSAAPQVPGA